MRQAACVVPTLSLLQFRILLARREVSLGALRLRSHKAATPLHSVKNLVRPAAVQHGQLLCPLTVVALQYVVNGLHVAA